MGRDGVADAASFRLCCSGGADGREEPAARREGGHGAVGHQLRRPLHLVHGRLLPRQVRRLAVSELPPRTLPPFLSDPALSSSWAGLLLC
jgi:hypothetical protein